MRCLSESFLHIDWDEEFDILYLEWYYYPGRDQFRESLHLALSLARQKSIKSGIVNVKQLTAMEAEEVGWLIDNWFPELFTLRIKKIAFVLPAAHFEELTGAFLRKVKISVLPFEIEFFAQVEAAYFWVKNNPLAGPNLHIE